MTISNDISNNPKSIGFNVTMLNASSRYSGINAPLAYSMYACGLMKVKKPLTTIAIARKKMPRNMRLAFGLIRQRIITARINIELTTIGISIVYFLFFVFS